MQQHRRSGKKKRTTVDDNGEGLQPRDGHSKRNVYTVPALCGLLVLAVFLVFGQTLGHDFVNYDDPMYVLKNPQVVDGLTAEGIAWAFTTGHANNWHPITWLSHMADCQLYDLWAGGHHLTNVLLHALTAAGLLLVLWRMTNEPWLSAFAAAVFAIHPLRAESVAWVAERKDVLSGLFFVATLAAYLFYVRAPFSIARYLLVVMVFALGLMAKPMLVTLPFLLLLLDYWPLRRYERTASEESGVFQSAPRQLVVEKIPLIVLALISCAATTLVQGDAVASLQTKPLELRVANALISYVGYAVRFFNPADLAAFYPYPAAGIPPWKAMGAFVALAAICAAVVRWRRQAPYLFLGWFWYLGMLVPVIGLVQVGNQAMADRYTYLPQIGLAIALAWGIRDISARWPNGERIAVVAGAIAVVGLMATAWQQTSYWRNSETLWRHALEVTSENPLAHHSLGCELAEQKRYAEGASEFGKCLAIMPNMAETRHNLGIALARLGKTDEAIAEYQQAIHLDPTMAEARFNLGSILSERGSVPEAIAQFEKALTIRPDYSDAHFNLGVLLKRQGKPELAVPHLREAIRQKPNDVGALDELAWTLATCPLATVRRGAEAVEVAQRAAELSKGQDANVLGTLAAALAEAGHFSEAIAVAQRAVAVAMKSGDHDAADAIQKQLHFYRRAIPYRDPPGKNSA